MPKGVYDRSPDAERSRLEAKIKKLDSREVRRQENGRELAERKQGTKKKKARNVAEAIERVESSSSAVAVTKPAAPTAEWREPTPGEVAQIKFYYKMANKPLVQLERTATEFGIVGDVPPKGTALVAPGEIPLSEDELDFGAQTTAGTLISFTPGVMPYLAPIGLACFVIGSIGSRLLILWRIHLATQREAERAAKEEERLAALRKANGAPAGHVTPMHAGTGN